MTAPEQARLERPAIRHNPSDRMKTALFKYLEHRTPIELILFDGTMH